MKYDINCPITGLSNSIGQMAQQAVRAEAELTDLCVITGLSREEIQAVVVKSQLSIGELVSFFKTLQERKSMSINLNDLLKDELLLDEIVKTVIEPDGKEMLAANLILGVEKVRRYGNKFYQLIWVNPNKKEAWFCKEDETEYRRKEEAVKAGEVLVKKVGALRFSEVTR